MANRALRRSMVEVMDRDLTLYDTLLARMVGAMDDKVPPPWEVCRELGVTYGGLLAWINDDSSGERLAKWRAMQEVRGQVLAEEALVIADRETDKEAVPSARLRVDTRFKLAQAYSPRVFNQDVPAPQRAPVSITIRIGQQGSQGVDDGTAGAEGRAGHRVIEHGGDGASGGGVSPGLDSGAAD